MTVEQIPLLPGGPRRRPGVRTRRPAAEHLPVARVALLTPVPHLDRLFDYEVPEALDAAAQPGVRVRVRLAGRLVGGFLLDRVAASDRELLPLSSVHGPPVLTADVATLCRAVADRYAGTLADVLRFAVPPRHARVETRLLGPSAGAPDVPADSERMAGPRADDLGARGSNAVDHPPAGWGHYRGGPQLMAGIGGPSPMRALWVAGPGEAVGERIADLVEQVVARGRGALVVTADSTEVDRVCVALSGHGLQAIRLVAEAGPEARYRAFLRILTGAAGIVVGTRAAVFAPVVDLGAIVVWDDGDESLSEPQAPGWHAREVAALRSAGSDVSIVIGGTAVTLECARMAQAGWLTPVELPREVLRARAPRVQVGADLAHGDPARASDRIPSVALQVLRDSVAAGPVLVSVPRAGYLPMLACQTCREPVRCPRCSTAMRADGPDRRPTCGEHGPVPDWSCPVCAGRQVRAAVVGVRRTAEEFGRALSGVPVVASWADDPVRTLVAPRCLVVATPGAEPDPGPDGYASLVVLDAAATLSRPGLRVPEEVVRRWFAAAALVRPASSGGKVVVIGAAGVREIQALIRWDPLGYAQRELAERRELDLPPAVRIAQLVGPAMAAGDLVEQVCEQLGGMVLRRSGPLHGQDDLVTWLVAVSIADGPRLAAALQHAQGARSARRAPVVASRMDPIRLR